MIAEIASTYLLQNRTFNIQPFTPASKMNFEAIPELQKVETILRARKELEAAIQKIPRQQLNEEQRLHYAILSELVTRDIQRFSHEIEFKKRNGKIPDDSLFGVSGHTHWYDIYLRHATSSPITAIEVFTMGNEAIQDIKHQIAIIQDELGYKGNRTGFQLYLQSSEFIIQSEGEIKNEFSELAKKVENVLGKFFTETSMKSFRIEPIPEVTKNSPPAYYNNDTFYFNFFNKQFNRRTLVWSYLHEVAPGHHYQLGRTTIARPYGLDGEEHFIGFLEGWGAYAEDLGLEMGLYKDKTMLLGKLEWQLIRAVRMVLDVRIHRDGWDKQQAMTYWRQVLPTNMDIAEREIARITQWPGQVTSYMVGSHAIKKIRQQSKQRSPQTFNVSAFHERLLRCGPVPLNVLSDYLLGKHK